MTNTVNLAPLSIADITAQYESLTAKQIRSLNYFAHGMSITQVSSLVNVKQEDIREWLKNEQYRNAMELVQRRSATWSYETQKNLLFLAEDKLEQILLQDYESVGAPEKREIARTARYVKDIASRDSALGLTPTGNSIYIEDDSAAMIAKHIKELSDNNSNDVVPEYDVYATPSNYVIHADTTYGVMNFNEEENTYQCHLCGGWYADVYAHAKRVHRGISREEYNEITRIIDSD